jgi:formylglycine-generating enzyme required for sulfatase activity
MDEARAYCTALGKRLPREEEWQFAATGGVSDQPYPWGYSAANASTTPAQITGTVFTGPDFVGRYPVGASPFGVLDLIGNVWQMTDEYQDNHTRSVILKGGANYRPSSSMWYFPMVDGNCVSGHCGMTTNLIHNKYFLMNPR